MRAITFDLWGTLFHDKPGRLEFMLKERVALTQSILDSYGFDIPKERIEEAFHVSGEEIVKIRKRGYDLDTPEQTRLLLSHLGRNPSHELVFDLEKKLSEMTLAYPPVLAPQTKEVLSFLFPKTKIGLISNTGRTPGRILRRILENLGILHLFCCLIFSNEVGLWKPNPQIFFCAAKCLKANPGDIIHVGDDLEADILGAKGAGMKAAFLGESLKADFCLKSLSDIVEVWERMG